MNKDILQRIKTQKKKPFGSLTLPGRIGNHIFSLVFVTYDCTDNSDIISLLSKWRKTHEFWFQAQFPVTDERTKEWLEKRVLDVPDRMLFLISVDGHYVGHVGLFRFDEKTNMIDIDNIVRGEEGYKGIMQEALNILMSWGKTELTVAGYTLQTTSDNEKALALYKRLGFTETKQIPLMYQKTNEGGEWIEVPSDTGGDIERYEVFMKREEGGGNI